MEAEKAGKETRMVKSRKTTGEDDMVETALAAAAAALFVSGMKTLLQCVVGGHCPGFLLGPSPFLFLLLQLVIASIVFVSTHPAGSRKPLDGKTKSATCGANGKEAPRGKRRQQQQEQQQQRAGRRRRERKDDGEAEKEERGGDGGCGADEVNARAEAFISAFRQHLKLDSVSSNARCGKRAASFRY